tara:strand:- start:255 stop:1328 length:1074 start_codon:yes stop_codon:yes gene_type:complete
MNHAKNLNSFLCKNHKKKYCMIVGNATTAIYFALISNKKIKYVGVPNNSCIHLPIAITLANCIPVFIDIDNDNYGVNLNHLKKVKIDCLISVHSYGKPSKIDLIKKICKRKNIYLIEDCAVAQGGSYKNNPLGSYGDVSIISFGKGKVIDAGYGGALLTNNLQIIKFLENKKKELKSLNKVSLKNIESINNLHTNIYNKHYLHNKKVSIKSFKSNIRKNSKHFLLDIPSNKIKIIYFKCRKLKKYINLRRKNFKNLRNEILKLKKNYLKIPDITSGEIPWRLNIFFNSVKKRNLMMIKLLSLKINVSSWYSGLDFFFHKDLKLKNSKKHSDAILNLWVNENYNSLYKKKILKVLNSL